MKKISFFKTIIMILIISILFSATSIVSFAAVWNGSATTSAPTKTNDGYYLISKGEELAWFEKAVNSSSNPSPSLKAKLTADIYLNDVLNNNYINVWNPIGDYSNGKVYSGIFDGCGYTIFGMKISTSADYQGLFGYLSAATVKNVRISSSIISAGSDVGAVCGYADAKSKIMSCSVNATINANGSNIGGITGYLNDYSEIESCAFSGIINNGQFRVGGIAGASAVFSNVTNSYNNATINSTAKFVGGIIGTNSAGIIRNCYNSGDVKGINFVGGLVGNNVGKIYCSFNASRVSSDETKAAISARNVQAEIEHCYYDSVLFSDTDEFGIPKVTDEMKRHAFVDLLNSFGGNYNYDYIIGNKGYPILSWQLDINLWNGSVSKPNKSKDGNYYLITCGEELAWFSALVNGTLTDGTGQNSLANAMLMNSIILNIGTFDENSNEWIPIGSDCEYGGYFDGNGFTVRGLYINGDDGVGLFGSTSATATVTNLTIAESSVTGTNDVGCLAGMNYGQINRVKVIYSEIKGTDDVGGIIGENGGAISDSSSMYCNVTGQNYVAGLLGNNYSGGVISTCCSFNTVNGKAYVGGIAGQCNSNISFSFNGGSVNATGNYVGGIAGTLQGDSTISNCYNTGAISGSSKVGGICGIIKERSIIELCYCIGEVTGSGDTNAILGQLLNGTVKNCYFDSQRIKATDKNATYKTTAQMTTTQSVANLTGFERSKWTAKADSDYFIYYPQITAFANSGDFDLTDASSESVSYLKYGLKCKVIVGDDVSYYATVSEATDYIGERKGTVIIFDDLIISSKAVVNGNVTIVSSSEDISISRANYLFDNPFVVNGTLNFGVDDNSYDTLVISGGILNDITGVKTPKSFINVSPGGTFNMYETVFTKNKADVGGFINNSGTTNLYSGSISSCEALNFGGVVYNSANLNIFATEIFNNNAKLCGGAVFNATDDAVTVVNTSAMIHNNISGDGGAFYIDKGSLSVSGGSIYLNSAANGGAIYNENGAVSLYDGSIYQNTASEYGNAVYNNATLNFASGGNVDSSNDVYLPNGKTVTMISKSLFSTSIVTITPEKYQENIRIVDGKYSAMNYKLCKITNENETEWFMNSSGHLLTNSVSDVAIVSYFGAYNAYYTSLEEAIDDIGNEPAVITLINDVTLKETLTIKGDVTIYSDGDVHTVSVADGFEGPMFVITENSTLNLEKALDDTGIETADIVFYDGSNLTGSCMFDVKDGKLVINDGVVIYGCNEIESAVNVEDTLIMNGGKISDNNVKKGAVYINGGEFDFFGGTIFDNTTVAVFADGKFTMNADSLIDVSNIVYLTENNKINIVGEYSESDSVIAKVSLEKYILSSSLTESEISDLSALKDRFILTDGCYYLNDNLEICAEMLSLIDNSGLIYNDSLNCVSGFNTDVNFVDNSTIKFSNENVSVVDKNNHLKNENESVATDDKFVLIDSNGDIYSEIRVLIYGDIDCDGKIDGNDGVLIGLYLSGVFTNDDFSELQLLSMDVNHDTEINYYDYWKIEDTGLFADNVNQYQN